MPLRVYKILNIREIEACCCMEETGLFGFFSLPIRSGKKLLIIYIMGNKAINCNNDIPIIYSRYFS
jgi:hypothetical protein